MSKFKKLDKRVKKMDAVDVGLTKWSVVAFVCFIISLFPIVGVYIMKFHWGWYLAAFVVLAWRPMRKFLG